ncbi:MAG: polyprenyl diphosphate synthase [Treponema sp.]
MNLQHIAVIMDGNGRWAQQRGLARTKGHTEGLEAAKRIVKAASDMGIAYITLYVFSTENWKRTEQEVGFLMGLIRKHLCAEFDFYAANNMRIRHLGNRDALPLELQADICRAIEETKEHTGTVIQLAVNYGGKDEIVRAVRKIAPENVQTLTETDFEALLDTAQIPPVDLLIRTGGEQRLSNFLLWQTAYAELYFTDVLWPDFTPDHLRQAIEVYQHRTRRFGGIV